jgi:myo-inositol-1(or 4)-monophosphatase
MTPTLDWLNRAEKHVRQVLDELRPVLLEAQGNIEHKLKDDKTIVTAMDVMVEDRLREALATFDPGVPFGGEESGVDYTQQTFWMADPIDGTESFARGLPVATNMLCLIDNGEPVMSIINNIALGDYYLAIKGQGALCNGHPIRVSTRELHRSFIVVGSRDVAAYEVIFKKVLNAVRMGAPGFEMSQIASGALEARIGFNGGAKPWDFAPGALLIQEAGGKVANIGSDTYDYRNTQIIAASATVFDELHEIYSQLAKG